jgi:hypothetical protein
MALASWQSYTLWFQTRHDKPLHESILRSYWNFFYATNEAHLTMMIVSLDCLYDKNKPKLQNFETLLSLIEDHVEAVLFAAFKKRFKEMQKLGKGIQIIRNHGFGHVTDKNTRESIGEKYALSEGDYLKLSYNTIKLATEIGLLLGEDVMANSPEEIADKDLLDMRRIYSALQSQIKEG